MINFYFDFTSPYSYLAWKQIGNIEGETIHYIPVMVGKIISNVGSIGPGEVKPKREYLFKDCLRKAHDRGITMKAPARLPFNPLPLLRMVCALEDKKEMQTEFIGAAYNYGWQEGFDYEDFLKFKSYVIEHTQIDENLYEDLESSKEARRQLKKNISEACEDGIFGVPSFKLENEVYWGDDSLKYLIEDLKNKTKSYTEEEFERFVKILDGENND